MRILYCIPNLEHGGAERQLSYVAAELAGMGHEVHVASRGGGPNLERMLSAGVVWHDLRTNKRDQRNNFSKQPRVVQAFETFVRLVTLIRTLRPNLVQTILPAMDILGGAAALLTRTPWVLKEGSSSLIYTTYRRYWLRFVFGRLSHTVISNSTHARDYWRQVRDTRRLHIIPNGLPLDQISEANERGMNGFKFGPDEKVVLYGGRIDLGKNVEALLEALARISEEVPFTAIVCGEGAHRGRAEQMAHELGIADRVIFTGNVDNLWSLMKRADVFVSLSRCEGSPNVVLEAMACGCPLVVSDIPGHREILDEQTALFVRLENPAEAAEAIRSVLIDATAARSRAAAAHPKATQRPIEATARQYEQVYLGLLAH